MQPIRLIRLSFLTRPPGERIAGERAAALYRLGQEWRLTLGDLVGER